MNYDELVKVPKMFEIGQIDENINDNEKLCKQILDSIQMFDKIQSTKEVITKTKTKVPSKSLIRQIDQDFFRISKAVSRQR